MQIIIYSQKSYDADLIQTTNLAMIEAWPLMATELIALFDTSSRQADDMPLLVRISSQDGIEQTISMSSLTSSAQDYQNNSLHSFPHSDNNNVGQLIFIDKNVDSINNGKKFVQELLKTNLNITACRRTLPAPLLFINSSFKVFYQESSNPVANRADTLYALNNQDSYFQQFLKQFDQLCM